MQANMSFSFLSLSQSNRIQPTMKFTAIFAIVTAVVMSSVGAVIVGDTNSIRLARGLPPLAPRQLGTRVSTAKRSMPSGSSSQCDSGPVQCCSEAGTPNDHYEIHRWVDHFGLPVGGNDLVGLQCSPVLGRNQCQSQTLCCKNNGFGGVISVGCSNISL